MEAVISWLVEDLPIGASPAEIAWILSNLFGAWLSIMTVVLSVADKHRVRRGPMGPSSEYVVRVRRGQEGIIVLANLTIKSELVRGLMHIGHGISGLLIVLSPEPARPQLTFAIAFVTVWFLISSLMLTVKTIWVLKARYDYKLVRKRGRQATWGETVRLSMREVGTDLRGAMHIMRRKITA
jgi:hypothetical protein